MNVCSLFNGKNTLPVVRIESNIARQHERNCTGNFIASLHASRRQCELFAVRDQKKMELGTKILRVIEEINVDRLGSPNSKPFEARIYNWGGVHLSRSNQIKY